MVVCRWLCRRHALLSCCLISCLTADLAIAVQVPAYVCHPIVVAGRLRDEVTVGALVLCPRDMYALYL
jgi:hypothetical protein